LRADRGALQPHPPLDPDRVFPTAEPAATGGRSGRTLLFALLLSLALHLSPLGLLWDWHDPPAEMPAPIPVQLVVEPPPAAPPTPAIEAAATPTPPGRLASEEIGAPADEPGAAAAEPAPEPEPETQEAMLVAPPKAAPPEPAIPDLPTPSLAPLPIPKPAAAPTAVRRPPPRPRQTAARVPGPAATRDEYLAYLATLTRPHLHLLPPALINGRRGKTSLSIRVLGDGTIARIAVSESSGHPDIDTRVVQIIAAIGRFPPLPQWIQAPAWDVNFHLRFPIPAAALQ
jgi:TonB family protein